MLHNCQLLSEKSTFFDDWINDWIIFPGELTENLFRILDLDLDLQRWLRLWSGDMPFLELEEAMEKSTTKIGHQKSSGSVSTQISGSPKIDIFERNMPHKNG